MVGFKTRHTDYFVDNKNKTVQGGMIVNPKEYKQAIIIIGSPAVFYFVDGTFMKTSTVMSYM